MEMQVIERLKNGWSLIIKTLSVKAASIWNESSCNSNDHLYYSTRRTCVIASQTISTLVKVRLLMRCVHRLHYNGEPHYTQSRALTVIFNFASKAIILMCHVQLWQSNISNIKWIGNIRENISKSQLYSQQYIYFSIYILYTAIFEKKILLQL